MDEGQNSILSSKEKIMLALAFADDHTQPASATSYARDWANLATALVAIAEGNCTPTRTHRGDDPICGAHFPKEIARRALKGQDITAPWGAYKDE